MRYRVLGIVAVAVSLHWGALVGAAAGPSLPVEPDEGTRLEEIFDSEVRLYLFLYSLKGDGKVDYVTGRFVREQARSEFGNPIYYTERHPMFYWWNHTLWSDREQDGVNGNEEVYKENVEFDRSRFKPCLFNGQPC